MFDLYWRNSSSKNGALKWRCHVERSACQAVALCEGWNHLCLCPLGRSWFDPRFFALLRM